MALKFSGCRWLYCAYVLILLSAILPACSAAQETSHPSDSSVPDQWEVAIAKDGYHHIYFLYSQLETPCLGCTAQPRLILTTGNDLDMQWNQPHQLTPPSFDQVYPALAVDANDQRIVYAVWLEREQQDIMLAKSSDFGQSWSLAVVSRAQTAAERPVIAARGQNVVVAFARDRQMWTASSHDGGITFEVAKLEGTSSITDVLPGGAAFDPAGNAYIAWEGYGASAAGQTETQLYISKLSESQKNWVPTLMDISSAPANCQTGNCEWGYLGAQITVASDAGGMLYALWNSDALGKRDVEQIYFSSSTTAGETWSPKVNVSSAPAGTKHVLPAIMAGAAGEVRIAWMDARNSPRWSAYSRSSTNGGATWSAEELLSMYVPNSGFIPPDNFDFMIAPNPEDARKNSDNIMNAGGL